MSDPRDPGFNDNRQTRHRGLEFTGLIAYLFLAVMGLVFHDKTANSLEWNIISFVCSTTFMIMSARFWYRAQPDRDDENTAHWSDEHRGLLAFITIVAMFFVAHSLYRFVQ